VRVLGGSIKLGLAHCGSILGIVEILNCDTILSIALSFTIGLDDFPPCCAFDLHNSTCMPSKTINYDT